MGTNTKIEWCHHTFNPWRGCSKVSLGCDHCYAEQYSIRQPDKFGTWGARGKRVIAAESTWRQPLAWNRAAERAGERRLVFCGSLMDWLEDRPELVEPRYRLYSLIHETDWLLWLLLTKRIENASKYWTPDEFWGPGLYEVDGESFPWPPPNVWLGVTVESQDQAWRIDELLKCPAAVRFVSHEPALGMVDWRLWLERGPDPLNVLGAILGSNDAYAGGTPLLSKPRIDWLISGGESGPGARPTHPDVFRSDRGQCQAAGVPFFFKQWGSWLEQMVPWPGKRLHKWPDRSYSVLVGKRAAGNLLDGRTWEETPDD